ncbi:apolipoprotein N-acyltransferase [Alphaproteobacteria bacterium 46_93_T64]|nr:apolipoprotein N-acyltransferase [Alphaproteobacteria bacterium 46_93_T64]
MPKLDQLPFWKLGGIAFVLGLLLATTFAPLHLIFFLPVCFSGLLILLGKCQSKWQAYFIGWWFGWGQFIAGLYWIGFSFTIDANAHAALIPIPTLILPAFLAIFCGLATLSLHILKARGLIRVLAFAGIWTLFEYIRGVIFTGFPWNLAGYSWGNTLPLMQWTAFFGIYGLTLLTVFVSSVPSILADPTLSQRTKNRYILADCAMLACLFAVGFTRLQAPPLDLIEGTDLRIVQPNNDQQGKWKPKTRFEHVRRLTELSREGETSAKYLIWPETAVPFFLTTDERLKPYLQQFVPPGGAIITGAPRKDPERRLYWNSVQALSSEGKILGKYDKRHLLPYGEYLPLRWFLKTSGISSLIPVLDKMSDFSFPEENASDILSVGNLPPARVLICYEVAFPWEIKGQAPFEWILNVTNDAWFGHTSGPYQHFVTSQTRAIEQGVSLIRSANKGVSAIVDGYGRVLQKRAPIDAGVIDGKIPSPIEGRTFYSKVGEFLPFGLTIAFILPALYLRRRSLKSS